jgi:pyruvate dehydrogenase E1 component alpha subunit
MAVIWKLPVVFVCENNLYMEYTPIAAVTAVRNPAADRAGAYGLEPIAIDGNDADLCYRTAMTAYERARAGKGPSLIEAKTYRHGGHSRADPASYRPQNEVDDWLKRDPIDLYRGRLIEAGVAQSVLDAIDAESLAKVDRATEEAKAGVPPTAEMLETNVWADGGSAWRN